MRGRRFRIETQIDTYIDLGGVVVDLVFVCELGLKTVCSCPVPVICMYVCMFGEFESRRR